jgi:hypothetical protein
LRHLIVTHYCLKALEDIDMQSNNQGTYMERTEGVKKSIKKKEKEIKEGRNEKEKKKGEKERKDTSLRLCYLRFDAGKTFAYRTPAYAKNLRDILCIFA